ncbi:MAG: 4-hydroxybenzoate octaprenyltransferase [Deltaproteobacteria bacterium]|nr:4-hydroxybenzoate octaprenyltransferase [Deltaproteobacteria bacterium]
MNAVIGVTKIEAVFDLIRLKKQYGTLLVLWPTLWSLVIASDGAPSLKHLTIFILGAFVMRSAGCAINDIADRKFDAAVERTRARPVASGVLSVKEAFFVFLCLSALAFALVLFLNTLTVMLSFIGIMLASAYPFVKRFSRFPQAVLGMAFGWGAVMAWAAVKGTVGAVPLVIFAANICWAVAYDTIYALMDMEDDLKIGVKSTAIFFGGRIYKALAALYAGFTLLLAAAGFLSALGAVYYITLVAAFIATMKIVSSIKKNPSREAAFKGFLANAVIGGVILAAVIASLNMR